MSRMWWFTPKISWITTMPLVAFAGPATYADNLKPSADVSWIVSPMVSLPYAISPSKCPERRPRQPPHPRHQRSRSKSANGRERRRHDDGVLLLHHHARRIARRPV